MKDIEQISDEILNALIDGELDEAEQARILEAVRRNPDLQRRIVELRRIKSLVLGAYTDVSPPARPAKRHWVRLPFAIAASILAFVLGAALAWTLFDRPQFLAAEGANSSRVSTPAQIRRVIFHMTRDDSRWLSMILQESESFLSGNDAAYVRIVASGDGLALLEKGSSPEAERIQILKHRFGDHLVFAGCEMTYALMLKANPGGIVLLPDVVMVESGVHDVMEKQSEGWTYIQI